MVAPNLFRLQDQLLDKGGKNDGVSKAMKNLVIVESPTKARTLTQFLGKDYKIVASMGHVRDLPRGEFGVDVEKDFEPKYVIPKEKIKAVNVLAKEAASAEHLFLATDPDREGEAIAWNLLQVICEKGKIKNPKYDRVTFHEITKDAVLDAFSHATKINDDLVEAQQARRVLDRLVGYKLSPLLWKKVKSGLSAGRVQSVALRLIVDREREIEAFVPEEYWLVNVTLAKKAKGGEFTANLVKIGDLKAEVKNGEQSGKVVADLEKSAYKILEVRAKDTKKHPNAPFTTSTLQQAAANRFGYTPKRTMRLAQDLYEQGLISDMRTDSVNLSPQAVDATRKYILSKFGKEYLPAAFRKYKAKSRLAQEAHEAIRPTNINVEPSSLDGDAKKLYTMIWQRMLVCQMAEAIVAETSADIQASEGYLLRTNGQKIKFDGWYKVYEKPQIKEQILPDFSEGEDLDLVKVNSQQKFTEPPSRYSEASLIKDLEKNDIGRPSTYAPTISTLYERLYIEKLEGRQIGPTPIGKTAVDFIVKYFPNIVDLGFTAKMEDSLDQIAQGKEKMAPVMAEFWGPFEKAVIKVAEEAEKMKVDVEVTDVICDVCGKPMVVRYGRFGKFLACSGFPDCKNTKPLVEETGMKCPDDGGNVITRKTKRGRMFWGCSNYPKCKWASWTKPQLPSSAGPDPKESDQVDQVEGSENP